MAYAALVSVAEILDQLLLRDGVVCPNGEVEDLKSKVCSLQLYVDELYRIPPTERGGLAELESDIRDVMYRAQDSIESSISNCRGIGGEDMSASLLFKEIGAKLDPLLETAEMMGRKEYHIGRGELLPENALPSNPSYSEKDVLIGLGEDGMMLMDVLLYGRSDLHVIKITGPPGIGKTAIARSIYHSQIVNEYFDICAWATMAEDNNEKRIVLDLLRSLGYESQGRGYSIQLYKTLYNRRYLIVMDNVWDISFWDQVRLYLPDNDNGSRIIITSTHEIIAEFRSFTHHVMRPLDDDHCWELLCRSSLGERLCPSELERVSRSIAQKCKGNAHLIVLVGGILSQIPMTENSWKLIEEDVQGAAATVDESYMKILYLSYNNLPPRLQPCFLYMTAFREDSEILVSKLLNLWVAEGFLTQPSSSPHLTLEQVAKEHLDDLITRNAISVTKVTSDGQPKSCSIQANMWQIAMQECQKHSFFHTMKRYTQQLPEGAHSQRRISIHNNLLLCSDDFYNCSKSIEAARTLVYAGPDDLRHPLPHFLTFEFLRVLDALSVYFVELPNALFELIHLRYLAFTYDEDLTDAIGKLHNLLTLIVRQHPKLIFKRISILPAAIWKLPQIRHLLFTESLFPVASDSSRIHGQNTTFFENLQTLSNVNAACCTKEILKNMPNLKKLCTWMEGPDDVVQFDIDVLPHLETFKFTVLKPIPGRKIEFQPKLAFPETVRKLSLSGCGLPWEDMEIIAQLPHLQVLKLRELAFQGQVWCPGSYEFRELRFLVFESLDFEKLDADDSHFPVLERLIIRHCYQLEEINSDIGYISSLKLLELVDCSPTAVDSVMVIKEEQTEEYGNESLEVRIYCSWKNSSLKVMDNA